MILNTSAHSVLLVQAGITYNATDGFWECATSFSSIGNSTVIHDYAVFGKLAYTSSPGAYPTGYDPDLFYYGFSYVHYTPVAYGNQPSYIVRFGLASSLEDAMERTPIIFADGGSGNLQFKSYGKFIKLVTTVPECCNLPYFNEGRPLLQLYPSSSSFDPEGLNVFADSYNDALIQHSQIGHDKIKRSVSFTCGVTRNSSTVFAPNTEGEIQEVINWINDQTLYHNSETDFTLGQEFQSTVKLAIYQQQFWTSAGSVRIYPGLLRYANGRRKPKSQNLLYYPFTEYFIENQLIVSNFSVDFGDPAGFLPYTPGPDKIVYRLSVTGQFCNFGNLQQPKTFSLIYELQEDLALITLGHLSGSKTLNLVSGGGYFIDNIPGTVTVNFSGDDYSAEVLPASLTLISPAASPPNQHGWTVNNYIPELPASIGLTKVGYNNYEGEFTTAVNVKNYIRLKYYPKDTVLGFGNPEYRGFTFQQWVQETGVSPYLSSSAQLFFYNIAVHCALNADADGSLFYPEPATVKMAGVGGVNLRLFKMAATNNGSSTASENSITVQYLLDWPLSG
jgi:hypothetical protein